MPVRLEPTNWAKVFGLVQKLVKYARGGFTHAEKLDLVIELMEVIGAVSGDIEEDIKRDVEERDGKGSQEDK